MALRETIIRLILVPLLAAPLAAQEYPPVEADIRIDLDSAFEDLTPVGLAEARDLADREAGFLLSGMIFGYSFSYRPLDRERGIEEEFELVELGEVAPERLVPEDVRGRENRVLLLYRYYPGREEYMRISSWLSAAVPSVIGYGEERYVLGHEGKMEAYRQALKEAVRDYLRPRVRNKPRRIEGELFLIDTPSVGVQAGKYTVRMRLKISLKKVDSYTTF